MATFNILLVPLIRLFNSIYDPYEVDGESFWAHWHGIKEQWVKGLKHE